MGLSLIEIAGAAIDKSVRESLYELELSLEDKLCSIGTRQVVVIEFMLILITILFKVLDYNLCIFNKTYK